MGDRQFALYCAQNAAEKLQKAILSNEISNLQIKCSLALTVAHFMLKSGKMEEVFRFFDIAAESTDGSVKMQDTL